jgi:hypothetical protein
MCSDNLDSTIGKISYRVSIRHLHFLTLKISSDQIWVAGYFGQPLIYPDFTIFRSDFFCNSLKS